VADLSFFKKEFEKLEKKLGLYFNNKDLLIQAFCHRSYSNENPGFELSNNERLEFLGDAVLELIVTEHLFQEYPEKPEGELTNWRAALVNAGMLSVVANEVGLNDYLLLSKGEERENGKSRQYILADTFEALIGASYLDINLGYQGCRKFIEQNLLVKISDIIEKELFIDAKSRFQEEAQDRVGVTPTYRVMKEWGPDHAKHFIIGAFLESKLVAEGEGSSKHEAEIEAAKKALEENKW
jgi:ribonuclease III